MIRYRFENLITPNLPFANTKTANAHQLLAGGWFVCGNQNKDIVVE